jgi:hypothetical protein
MVASAVAAVVAGAAGIAFAAPKLPTPGSAAQVASLVAKSSSIEKLPKDLLPPLTEASKDSVGWYDAVAARTCVDPTKCVFGDIRSKTTVVLLGDSHAQMWLTALVPVVQRARDRLALVWRSGCPAATITVWDASTHTADTGCSKFRAAAIAAIKKLAPAIVLLADRTSDIPGAGNVPTTNAAWQSGLETTISELKTSKTKVAVIGDITAFSGTAGVIACLATYPSAVQKCAVPNPNSKTHQHFVAEMAAAAAERVPYVNPQPWLCTKTCSPVIGNMVVYYDSFHVSATYAEYLSGVLGAALQQAHVLTL